MFHKLREFGASFMGPFNYDWKALNPIELSDLQSLNNNLKNRFQFGFWLRSMTKHPNGRCKRSNLMNFWEN